MTKTATTMTYSGARGIMGGGFELPGAFRYPVIDNRKKSASPINSIRSNGSSLPCGVHISIGFLDYQFHLKGTYKYKYPRGPEGGGTARYRSPDGNPDEDTDGTLFAHMRPR